MEAMTLNMNIVQPAKLLLIVEQTENFNMHDELKAILVKYAEPSESMYLITLDEAIKAIQELVCSTVPEEKCIESFDASDRSKWGETYLKATQCKADYFNRCRTEILKKWS